MDKQKIILLAIFIFINLNVGSAQLRNQWVFCDSIPYPPIVYNGITYYVGYSSIDMKYSVDGSISTLSKRQLISIFEYLIRNSSDEGKTWQTIYLDTTNRLNSSVNEMNLTAILHPTKSYIVTNGFVANFDTTNVSGKQVINTLYRGFIMYSNDLCKSWNKIIFDTNSSITNLTMVDSLNGIAEKVPYGTKFIKDSLIITKDGWKHYEKIEIPDYIVSLNSKSITQISYIEPNIILIHNYDAIARLSTIYRSEDGAKTWDKIPLPDRIAKKIKFIDKMHGFALFQNNFYKTIDGGLNWVKFKTIDNDTVNYGSFSDFDFTNKNQGFIINGSNIYFTQNSGIDLISERFSNPGFFLSFIINPSIDNSFICSTNSMIYKRTKNQILKTPNMNLWDYHGR